MLPENALKIFAFLTKFKHAIFSIVTKEYQKIADRDLFLINLRGEGG